MSLLDHHRPWCANPDDTAPEHACATSPLRLEFLRVPATVDQVGDIALGLERDPQLGEMCNVLLDGSSGFSLAHEQMRPLAMGLLAKLATLDGDMDLAAFYRGEALRGTAAV